MKTQTEREQRRTQTERSAESAGRLRNALAELVIENGYERTTAAQIGERAGYSRAMVRERYGSKDALLVALHQDYAALLLGDSQHDTGTGFDEFMAGIDRLVDLATTSPTLLRAIFIVSFEAAAEGHVMRPVVDGWLNALGARARLWVEEGQRDGSVREGLDVDELSEQFLVEAIGIAYRWTQMDASADFVPAVEKWRSRIVSGISAG